MPQRTFFKQNIVFFAGYLVLLLIAFFLWLLQTKEGAFILLNPYHSIFLNFLFIGITMIGDGFFSIGVCIALFLVRRRLLAAAVFASFATSGICAQVLKYFISEARPALLLEHSGYHYFIENVTLHNFHSFPSGHSTSAFALFATLAFAIKEKSYSLFFLIMAALVGYSRIYLGQHFITDVSIGSLLGVAFAIACWLYLQKFAAYFSKKRSPLQDI